MKKNKKPVDATVGMAVMDAFLVLFFAVAMILIGLLCHSVIFDIGAVLCILAGAGKVIWKFGLAVSGKNRAILNKQFRYLMIGGFAVIIISLIVRRPSASVIWKNVSSFPCNILIIIGIAGMVVMGILLGAYATKSLGDLPVLAVYGSEDGVLNREKLEEGRSYSDDYKEVCIDGGNHAWFGCYGEQAGDGTATISREEQRQETIECIMELINK